MHTFAGVRSLFDDGSRKPEDVTRDYHIACDRGYGRAPLVTVYGGKITTYRRLAEAVLGKLADVFVPAKAWTAQAPLPGGDFPFNGVDALIARVKRNWPFLTDSCAERLVSAYGTRVDTLLGKVKSRQELGAHFGADLYEAEIRYLMAHEWALDSEDILWRRTKLGLRLDDAQVGTLERFMRDRTIVKAAE